MLSVSAWKRCALLHVNGFTYGPLTPLLAYFMAFLGSVIGLQSASRARAAAGASRVRWLTMGSLALGGTAIWVMPPPVSHHRPLWRRFAPQYR